MFVALREFHNVEKQSRSRMHAISTWPRAAIQRAVRKITRT